MKLRVTSKGLVTIPAAICRQVGLRPGMEVNVEYDGESVRITPVAGVPAPSRGARLIAHMRGRGDILMSTDEIMALMRDQ